MSIYFVYIFHCLIVSFFNFFVFNKTGECGNLIEPPAFSLIANIGNGEIGEEYYGQINGENGDEPYQYSTVQNLPLGLILNENTGEITGVPDFTSAGDYTITFVGIDSIGSVAILEVSFSITTNNNFRITKRGNFRITKTGNFRKL